VQYVKWILVAERREYTAEGERYLVQEGDLIQFIVMNLIL
jgi:hypothetical protein